MFRLCFNENDKIISPRSNGLLLAVFHMMEFFFGCAASSLLHAGFLAAVQRLLIVAASLVGKHGL